MIVKRMFGFAVGPARFHTFKKEHLAPAIWLMPFLLFSPITWQSSTGEKDKLKQSLILQQDYYCAKSVIIFWNKGSGFGD